jgi:hypothetical protein
MENSATAGETTGGPHLVGGSAKTGCILLCLADANDPLGHSQRIARLQRWRQEFSSTVVGSRHKCLGRPSVFL